LDADTLFRCVLGESTPAAANFQHPLTGAQAECIDDALVFARLRRLQRKLEVPLE
jgi:hypothetical protein